MTFVEWIKKPVILIWRILQGRNLTSRALQSSEVAVDRQEPVVLQRLLDSWQKLANRPLPQSTTPGLHPVKDNTRKRLYWQNCVRVLIRPYLSSLECTQYLNITLSVDVWCRLLADRFPAVYLTQDWRCWTFKLFLLQTSTYYRAAQPQSGGVMRFNSALSFLDTRPLISEMAEQISIKSI